MGDYAGKILDAASRILAALAIMKFLVSMRGVYLAETIGFLIQIYSSTTHWIFDWSIGILLSKLHIDISIFYKDLIILYLLFAFAIYRGLKRLYFRDPDYSLDGSVISPMYNRMRIICAFWPAMISAMIINITYDLLKLSIFGDKAMRRRFWSSELVSGLRDIVFEILFVFLVVLVILMTNALVLDAN